MQKFASKLSKRHHKPLQASDLITALTAHYHNKLSTVEMDEIILDGLFLFSFYTIHCWYYNYSLVLHKIISDQQYKKYRSLRVFWRLAVKL